MNYLAHLFLSGDHEALMIGNFIGDHVKGSELQNYSKHVVEGVKLHRFIDLYTDTHPRVLQSKIRLRPTYRKYSPVIVDMYFDHFLAVHWKNYSTVDLQTFSLSCYKLIEENLEMIPASGQHLFRHMSLHNWLMSYSTLEGLDRALSGMANRASFNSGMENATGFLKKNYAAFEDDFLFFFDDISAAVKEKIRVLNLHQS